MNDMLKNVVLWVVVAVVLMSMFNSFGARKSMDSSMSYSQFLQSVRDGQIKQVTLDGPLIRGLSGSGEKFTTYSPPNDPHMVDDLVENHVDIKGLGLLYAPDAGRWRRWSRCDVVWQKQGAVD